ncbi:4Fe-4S binding protein [Methanobacterium alcaliphilum]|uniref:4Fe-4S binding protein n=1 Tax=Methanobacterium alcaliphilum TaxID=392018 RepID=UPI00200A3966|nr:4Fe-4S binding protein [Methanobacterium alcaliphilum]MCK9152169.1 4Fe-4S binding protein [Methanobacterium alcaliphilum]
MKFLENRCGYCGACVSVCPLNILEHDEWKIILKEGCKQCGNCIEVCPLGAIEEI